MAIWSAILLAMSGALFGVCIARVVWSDDLKHAQRLRQIWDQTEAAMRSTIDTQNEQLKIYRR